MKDSKNCRITMEDPDGNKVELLIDEDSTIHAWIEAFRKILMFQGYHQNNITERLGDA